MRLVFGTDHNLKQKDYNINQLNLVKLDQVWLSPNRLESAFTCEDTFYNKTPKFKQALSSFNVKFRLYKLLKLYTVLEF